MLLKERLMQAQLELDQQEGAKQLALGDCNHVGLLVGAALTGMDQKEDLKVSKKGVPILRYEHSLLDTIL